MNELNEIIKDLEWHMGFLIKHDMLSDDLERKNQAKGSIAAFGYCIAQLNEILLGVKLS